MKKTSTLLCLLALTLVAYAEQSAYITRVYEFMPAPGQFTNNMPKYADGDTEESMRQKAEQILVGDNTSTLTLGSLGGYVVFGFDHSIENKSEQMDLQVFGNSFLQDEDDPSAGGSSEPGIVWVMEDANGNGLPDDTWYELAGSEYDNEETRHNYTITYYRPSADHEAIPSETDKSIIDKEYIRWTDSEGVDGYLEQNSFHRQAYYPEWVESDELTFRCTRLPNNTQKQVSENTTKYVQYPFAFGYADNLPDGSVGAKLNIDWAVDEDGRYVHLKQIHFVKVATGILQSNGWIGEISTEVMKAVDLHVLGETVLDPWHTNTGLSEATVEEANGQITVYTLMGQRVGNSLPKTQGIYVVYTPERTYKYIHY